MRGIRHAFGKMTGVAVLSVLAACSTSKQSVVESDLPAHMQFGRDNRGDVVTTYKVGNPYEVAGVWYYPAEDFGYREEGIASWYGPGFHGKRTANGEKYDMNALTAAHKTLPMPSVVLVTNLENGRALKLRINDRGPFVDGRIIDLSRRAAQLLDVERHGVARVRVELVPEDSLTMKNMALGATGAFTTVEMPPVTAAPRATVVAESLAPPPGQTAAPAQTSSAQQVASAPITSTPLPPPTPVEQAPVAVASLPIPSGPGLYIQAGAFTDLNNARRLEAQLSDMGNAFVAQADVNGRTFHRVRVGPLPDQATAQQLLSDMIAQGYDGATIIDE